MGLELDGNANIINYEEYHPYGTVAYTAANATINSTAKRYRYTGMERDEESGLSYHTARYYLPWLGRWFSADPNTLIDGVNLYRYGRNNPLEFSDAQGTHVTDNTQGRIGSRDEYLTGSGATGRYLFTRGGGWIDRSHAQPGDVVDVLRDLNAGREVSLSRNGLNVTYNPPELEEQNIEEAAISITYDFLKRYESYQENRFSDRFAATPFSYEDLTSNRVGIEIGVRFFREAQSRGLDIMDENILRTEEGAALLEEVEQEVIDELNPDLTGDLGDRLYYDFVEQYRLVTRGEWVGEGYLGSLRDYSPFQEIPRNRTVTPLYDETLSPVVEDEVPEYLQNDPPEPLDLGISSEEHRPGPDVGAQVLNIFGDLF